jgi:AraC-like DNA-binding protein
MPKPPFISDQVEEGRYYFLDLEPPAAAPLAVVCGGQERCGRHYHVKRASFRYTALEYVEAGEGELWLGERKFALQASMVFAYEPGTPHEFRSTGTKRLLKHFVDFCGSESAALLRGSGLHDSRPRVLAQTRWVQNHFEQLLDSGQGRPAFAQTQCSLLLRLLLNRLAEDMAPPQAPESAAFATFCRCRRYLTDYFVHLMTIADAAEACDLDPAYLARLFKRYAGEGAYVYLIRQKMRHSAGLLTSQGLSVKAAARAVGYDDPYHYSRVFKRVYGVSPQSFVRHVRRSGIESAAVHQCD